MNYFKKFISDLLTEVSYRTKEGIVNLKNPDHISILSEVLDEMGLWEIKSELFQNLFEAGEQTLDPDEKKKVQQMGLVWKGQGWGKEGEKGIQYKVEKGKLVPFERDGDTESDTQNSDPNFWNYLDDDNTNTEESEDEIEDGVDRGGFDKKSKKQKDAPDGPTSQQILDDLNEGNIDKLIEYQNEVEKNRAKGIAGAGGAVASEGESKYCNACNLDKEQWKKDNESELQRLKDELRDKKRTADEERTATALGLESDSPEFLDVLAEAQLFCNQKLAEVKADKSSVFYLKDKKGFGGSDDAYCDWMKVGYLGAIVTEVRLKESNIDTSQSHKVVQSTTELDDSVEAHLEDMYKKAETPEDKAYYKKQLKNFKKFRKYHDTYAIGKDANGRTTIVSISNKKDSQLRDPQNNTTPAQRLRDIISGFGDKIAKNVSDVLNDGLQKVADASINTIRSQTKMVIDDNIVRICEEERMAPYMEKLDAKATAEGDQFFQFIQSSGKNWASLSTKEKLELMQEYANSRLYDKDGNSRLFTKEEQNEDGEVVEVPYYIMDDGTEKKLTRGTSFPPVGLPFEPFGKIAIKLGEFKASEETIRIKTTEKELVTEVHTQITEELFKADADEGGYHPTDRPDADNGKNTQGYISSIMSAIHIDTYIDMDDEDDSAILIQMGVNGVKPSMVRECVAEKSGYKGDINTPDGRAGLKQHILKRCRVTPGGEKVSIMDGGKEVELFNDQWRTAGKSQKVASYFGNDMRECLQEKAKLK